MSGSDLSITLTDAAQARFRAALTEHGGSAVRLSLREAGCSGLEYVVDYADGSQPGDLEKSYDGFTLLVDPEAYAVALQGLTIDYQEDLLSSGFIYINPNKTGECGCGKSFSV